MRRLKRARNSIEQPTIAYNMHELVELELLRMLAKREYTQGLSTSFADMYCTDITGLHGKYSNIYNFIKLDFICCPK